MELALTMGAKHEEDLNPGYIDLSIYRYIPFIHVSVNDSEMYKLHAFPCSSHCLF